MDRWVKIPTQWIRDKDNPLLKEFRWHGDEKADYIAALMLYMTIAHHANRKTTSELATLGCAKLSYSALSGLTELSRAKIAAGLRILVDLELIEKNNHQKTNIYRIVNYETRGGWAKLPAVSLYSDPDTIRPFRHFKLRLKNELYALKLYLLLVAFRNNPKKYAILSYDRIAHYTGISRNDIRSAISLLVNLDMVLLYMLVPFLV